tara:strand:+ start:95577 stop:95846 length:270 start_codon:yes stop_codon:yes gene_type:complete
MNYLKDLSIKYNIQILPQDELVIYPKIGNKYNLSWANKRGMVWILDYINGDTVRMITPKTKKVLETKTMYLRETNKNILANARKRINRQ